MTNIDWKAIAPHRSDWEALSAAFVAAGLPAPSWVNGIATWKTPPTAEKVQAVVDAFTRGDTPKQKTATKKKTKKK